MLKDMPAKANLSVLKKQAKQLKQQVDLRNSSVVYRINDHLPDFSIENAFTLADAQFVIAREHGFLSWSKLKKAVEVAHSNTTTPSFSNRFKRIVNITNGDSVCNKLGECNIPGARIALRDLYNFGPLINTKSYEAFFLKRADYLKSTLPMSLPEKKVMVRDQIHDLKECLSADTIILWMWPRLTDQLTLLLLIDWFISNDYQGTLKVIETTCPPDTVGAEALHHIQTTAVRLTQKDISLAQSCWHWLRQNTPEGILRFIETQKVISLHLKNALLRFIEELPNDSNGLGRIEQTILEAISNGCHKPWEIFSYQRRQERFPFVGDWSVWAQINLFVTSEQPLLFTEKGKRFIYPPKDTEDSFNSQIIKLTSLGEDILFKNKNYYDYGFTSRWWGGTLLIKNQRWAYNKESQKLISR